MILAELIRRGRGERILIVTPRHVLEQMQHEMWSRFAIPFVRLDSQGIQRVRQKLPASRNPFTYFKRVIISIDTLKSDRYLAYLRNHAWDAVVIDESHNVTNAATLNNRLARTLAPNTDALILASATSHNGKAESFAELIRLLEPTAVRPDGTLIEDEVRRLIVRRHRHSPEVASVVGADWAERKERQNWLAWWWRSGAVGCLTRWSGSLMELALVIDDREQAILEDGHDDAWREWLRISNALNLREQPTLIPSVSEALSRGVPGTAQPSGDAGQAMPAPWQAIRELAVEGRERRLVERFASYESLPVPMLGYETLTGTPIDIAWPDERIAVCLDHDFRADLESDGWRVFSDDDPSAIATALSGGEGT